MHRSTPVMLSFLFLFPVSLTTAQSATGAAATVASSPSSEVSPAIIEPSGENWSTIDLAKSGLPPKAIGGMPISKIDLPGCTRELLRMQWRPDDPIDLYITRPRGAEKLPAVLFLYNYTVDTDVFRQDRWCDWATRNGFAAVGFPSVLSWQRLHSPRPMKEWFVSELQEALASSTHDVQMVLNYLASRGDLDVRRVGVFGQGSGGATAILAAAADPRIVALDLMNPWGDWPDWLRGSRQIPEEERATYLQASFLQQVADLDPIAYLPRLKTQAISIQQTGDDLVTPPDAREKIAAATPAAGDVAYYPNMNAVAKALGPDGIVDWLGKQVRSEQATPANSARVQGKESRR